MNGLAPLSAASYAATIMEPLDTRYSHGHRIGDAEQGAPQSSPQHRRESSAATFPVMDDEGKSEKAKDGSYSISVTTSDEHHTEAQPTGPRLKLPFRQRLRCFTWAWYTLPMSTGGLSLVIFAQPHQFPGLRQIGLAVYILNMIVFTAITSTMLARFLLCPGTFSSSITHGREGFFVPTFFLATATAISNTQRYALSNATGEGPLWIMKLVFWFYLAATITLAIGQYSMIFSMHTFKLRNMMPTWILPIFPVMLSGTIASVLAPSQPAESAVEMAVAGLTAQGLGFSVTMIMYSFMVGRLMLGSLPDREHRPGLFITVGPPAFTALAFVGLAQGLTSTGTQDMEGLINIDVLKTMAVVGATFLWALSFWWFGIALVAVIMSPPRYFHLGWWASVFPNSGFVLATISIGTIFNSPGVLWAATGMSVILLVVYLFVLYHHVRAVIVQDIMYPGQDEDVLDH